MGRCTYAHVIIRVTFVRIRPYLRTNEDIAFRKHDDVCIYVQLITTTDEK